MMPRNLSIVDDFANIGSMQDTEPEIGITELCHIECSLHHVITEILAIGTGIGN